MGRKVKNAQITLAIRTFLFNVGVNDKNLNWIIFLVFILSLTLLSLFTNGITMVLEFLAEKLDSRGWNDLILGLIVILICVGVFFCLWEKCKGALKKDIVIDMTRPEPAKVLIIFLSVLVEKKKGLFNDAIVKNETIEQLLADFKKDMISWEMPLVAINHHLPRLERLYVITSKNQNKDNTGSNMQYDSFIKMIDKYYPQHKFIINKKPEDGVDFENVEAIFNSINDIYTDLEKEKNFNKKDTILDITGGQKPTSMAGAFANHVYNRRYQYISTNTKEIYSYNIVILDKEN